MGDKWWVWAKETDGTWRIDARFRTQADARRFKSEATRYGSSLYAPGLPRVITRTRGGVPVHPDHVCGPDCALHTGGR